MLGGGSYNKDTYIGYLKMKNGGMKVIPGEIDDSIVTKRNNILAKLERVLSGGDELKEKNIDKYFKALGGKYVRNDMCLSGNRSDCKQAKKISMGGAKKLVELGSKKYNAKLLDGAFKGAAPILYEKYIKNVGGLIPENESRQSRSDTEDRTVQSRGGYEDESRQSRGGYEHESRHPRGDYEHRSRHPRGGYEQEYYQDYDNRMYGGKPDIELENLRKEIGHYQYFSGGSTTLKINNVELNKLRSEIDNIRNF